MASFLFWNLRRRPLAPVVGRLVSRHGVDVLILAECAIAEADLLRELQSAGNGPFWRVPAVASRGLDL